MTTFTTLGNRKIVFIGAGNMAEAIVRGILKAGLCPPRNVTVTDVDPRRLEHFQTDFKVRGLSDNAAAAGLADVLVLALKPQVLLEALQRLRGCLAPEALVISIAAGITTARIETVLGAGVRVVRVMPNMAALVGAGAAAFCLGTNATEADAQLVEAVFKSVGMVVRLEEAALDAVTALCGSGPAYVFYLAEAMQQAGREMGLEAPAARALTAATIAGAGRLLAETGLEPKELRRRVTSKGGTTAAAVKVLDDAGVKAAWVAAIKAARDRAHELSS